MEYMKYILDTLEKIVNTPSPSGCTGRSWRSSRREAEGFGFQTEYNRKGGLIITVPGQTETVVAFSGHVDTLGLWCALCGPAARLPSPRWEA